MQDAETVLGVLRDRGGRGLPLNELYRQLFNPQLYKLAYGRIYANKGAMTPGADRETADGMSLGPTTWCITGDPAHRTGIRPALSTLPATAGTSPGNAGTQHSNLNRPLGPA
jgi:hypothetical protein